jgi:hypothetical protein
MVVQEGGVPSFNRDIKNFLLVGLGLPEPGCWEVTARYKGAYSRTFFWSRNKATGLGGGGSLLPGFRIRARAGSQFKIRPIRPLAATRDVTAPLDEIDREPYLTSHDNSHAVRGRVDLEWHRLSRLRASRLVDLHVLDVSAISSSWVVLLVRRKKRLPSTYVGAEPGCTSMRQIVPSGNFSKETLTCLFRSFLISRRGRAPGPGRYARGC